MGNRIVVLVAFLCIVFFAFTSVNTRACEVCSDVVETFGPADVSPTHTVSWLEDVYLNLTNTIVLKGHDSVGMKSLSIDCTLLCGKVNQPCCFDEPTNEWLCEYDYMFCTEQNENGICAIDPNPPDVNIVSQPSNAVPTSDMNCEDIGFLDEPAIAYVGCDDNGESGCDESSYRLSMSTVDTGECDQNYNYYYSSSGSSIERPYYVCAAAMDKAGNVNFTPEPVQFCVSSGNPVAPALTYDTIGGKYVDLMWYLYEKNSPNFDRYEIHYIQQDNGNDFEFGPSTLLDTLTEEDPDGDNYGRYTVDGLTPETRYCFKIVVFDLTSPKALNSSSVTCVTTLECDPESTVDCFVDAYGHTTYQEGLDLPGVCEPGTATCYGGYWGGCYDQTGPNAEICNGVDDDCDNFIDNYYTYDPYPLFQACTAYGECGAGVLFCENGSYGDDKINCMAADPEYETCDGLDNDCDGIRDNVDGKTSVEETKCRCYGDGLIWAAEVCNGIDDDCNGIIDDVYDPSTCQCYDGGIPGDEICDGIDNDCNGIVDDDWLDGTGGLGKYWPYIVTSCAQNTPCQGGYWECTADGTGTVCSTVGGSNNIAAAEEDCSNTIDDDCDGTENDGCACTPPGISEACGSDVGQCQEGIKFCESGVWSECSGNIVPVPEVCNGLDDDCDGVIDNVFGGLTVEDSKCGCYSGGTPSAEICNGIDDDCDGVIDNVYDGYSSETSKCGCYDNIFEPGENKETCNDIDDDCNGVIDDNWENIGDSCGYGICSGGDLVCSSNGVNVVCSTTSFNGIKNTSTNMKQAEVCNGLDDDCNGIVDDINSKYSIEETHCGCFGGAEKGPEICNKIDDDCDGSVDEEIFCICFAGQEKPCGSPVGSCETGIAECDNGVWGECTGGVSSKKETCNMKDDNCDGVIDNVGNAYSVDGTQCGCYNGRSPSIEICDGIDNDCNGVVDDDVDCRCEEGDEMVCGSNVGNCMPGLKSCINGKWGECVGGVLPELEKCNGKDNDCDGIIDNVNGGNSISSTKCACYNRYAIPGAQDEIPNGIDDDCDTKIDEGFVQGDPPHCSNGVKDSGEEGVDCGGPCRNACFVMPELNTWMIIFAAIAGVIAIFGIFFSSYLKKSSTSLFDRTK